MARNAGSTPEPACVGSSLPQGTPHPSDRSSLSDVPLDRILEPVRSYWGFTELRPLQEEAIRASLAGRDSVVVLPTGGGKSLCYQVPPLLTARTDIVVSPLISLMKDQVDGLRACGYPAAAVHSGLAGYERDQVRSDVEVGRLRLLFVSPERLLTSEFLDFVEKLHVRSFAIDEAHCISHWGHDFRPEYRKLSLLKKRFPKASVHAFTATATPRVRADIAAQLQLSDHAMLVGIFDRPNLVYRVVPREDVYAQTLEVVRRHDGEGVIIYCLSRKDTEVMADSLKAVGIDARAYHAGLSHEQRRSTQDAFAAESLNVVAATVAFGMGIDRSNVRCVIHATMPKSVEHYQQETGRAGRDGLEAECVFFYSVADVMRWQWLIKKNANELPDPEQFIATQTSLLEEMRRVGAAPRCRHRALSEYFGQRYTRQNCEACDVCLGEAEGVEEATVLAQKILSCVARIEQISGSTFGVAHTVEVLLGSDTEMIRRRSHNQASTYGILKGTPKKTVTNWVYQLLDQDLLDRTTGDRPVLRLNNASWEVMRGQQTVRLIRAKEEPVQKTRAAIESWEGVDRDLFEHLRGVRRELADRDGVPAWLIFNDRTLRDLARRRPTTHAVLEQVHGVGDAKMTKFGDRFLKEIKSFCGSHSLSMDVPFDPSNAETEGFGSRTRRARGSKSVSAAKKTAFDLFSNGASVEEVMASLARARSTTFGYLCEFIDATAPKSIKRWVDPATYTAVARAAEQVGTERLKPIFDFLDEKVPYEEIRLVVTHLDARVDETL